MRLKFYVVDLEIPRPIKRVALLVAVPASLIMGVVAVAYASLTTFKSGDPLSASTMNANFADLNTRLSAIETLLDGGSPDAGLSLPGVAVWKDSAGAVIPVVGTLGDTIDWLSGYADPPQGYLYVYDSTSGAVWVMNPGSFTPIQETTKCFIGYASAGCTGTAYFVYPPPSRWAFSDDSLSGPPSTYYVVLDNAAQQVVSVLSQKQGGVCYSTSGNYNAVPLSSTKTVTIPSAPPGVPPYHPERL